MPGIRFALIASLALLATACHAPEPPPTDEPPEPLATASTTPSGTELRDAMQAMAQDAGLRVAVGAANRAKAVAEYDKGAMIARYAALYGEAMGRPGILG